MTPQLVRFIVDEGRHVLALAPRWRVPTLLLWAQGKINLQTVSKCIERDCGGPEAAKKFFTKSDNGGLKLNVPRIAG